MSDEELIVAWLVFDGNNSVKSRFDSTPTVDEQLATSIGVAPASVGSGWSAEEIIVSK